jgi:hypothetical protein
MHNGVKYSDCNSPKAPSVIVGKGHLTDFIVPCNYVQVEGDSRGALNFLPDTGRVRVDSADVVAKRIESEVKGETLQVLLPIKTRDAVNDYTFTFRVNSVSAVPRAKNQQTPR